MSRAVNAVIVLVVLAATQCVADTCDTWYLLSTSQPSPSSVLTVAAINSILTVHNNARRTVSPYAATMPMLTWNQSLANIAQNYMSGCPGLVHSTNAQRSNVAGFSYIGENLAAGTGSNYQVANGGAASTAAWNSEKQYWSYGQVCQSGQACGHYTQVIWANTLQVGCGYAYCPNQPYVNYWSCNYGPGGNYVGQKEYVSTTTSPAPCQILSGQATPTPAPPLSPYTNAPPTVPSASALRFDCTFSSCIALCVVLAFSGVL